MKKKMKANAMRFTVHRIEDGDQVKPYAIDAYVLSTAATKAEAVEIASTLGPQWYYGVAIWDHLAGTVDFGGVEDEETGYEPLQPASKVLIAGPRCPCGKMDAVWAKSEGHKCKSPHSTKR
jgi:hypothetical protein